MTLDEYLIEGELTPQEIDINKFPNPVPEFMKKHFKGKGLEDGVKDDDKVKTVPVTIGAKKLKPSQSAIYLAKTLAMAMGGVKGGDLGAVISKDNYILDGHHRWAATMFNDPTASIKGYKANLNIGDLVPVLRALGDSYGNERRGEPKGGDINLFDANLKQAMATITTGAGIPAKWYDKDKAAKWLEEKGGENGIAKALAFIQSIKPPQDAPPRKEMPVIDPDKGEVKKTAKLLNKGAIDVRKPYAADNLKKKDNKRSYENVMVPTYSDFLLEEMYGGGIVHALRRRNDKMYTASELLKIWAANQHQPQFSSRLIDYKQDAKTWIDIQDYLRVNGGIGYNNVYDRLIQWDVGNDVYQISCTLEIRENTCYVSIEKVGGGRNNKDVTDFTYKFGEGSSKDIIRKIKKFIK